ncbi:MAG: tautomerase family protein [Spirochaetes bacterium]|uniref:Tautomerase family protein n=1 Tax=Candidatus Gallitreponema excrementavium TaxID=2840840 RepID=A0A9D9N2E8_9SPIR|nr:tautomerase family protein [Candidatus Gallitreponema excrementavium]
MPHITIQMYPGRDEETKKRLAEKIAKTASEELNRGIEHFSVSIEDIPQEKWKTEVFDKITDPANDTVYVKPGYTM